MRHRINFLLYGLCLFFLASCDQHQSTHETSSNLKEAPNFKNSPNILGIRTKSISQIISRSMIEQYIPWSGYYWPSSHFGIASRWQTALKAKNPYNFYPMSLNEIFAMPPQEIDRLSPAEKFDLYQGYENFPLTRRELDRSRSLWNTYNTEVPTWFGICEGWAIASIVESEPLSPVRAPTRFGFDIEFNVSDIKAIMSYYYAQTLSRNYKIVGGRCNDRTIALGIDGRPFNSDCRDLNPATLHLALDHFIGRLKQPFIADIDEGQKVWNHPIIGYQFSYGPIRLLSQTPSYYRAAPGTVYLIDVDLDFSYVASTYPRAQAIRTKVNRQRVSYTIELDYAQNIIGGEWISQKHPDFLWQVNDFYYRPNIPLINYRRLSQLIQAAQRRP